MPVHIGRHKSPTDDFQGNQSGFVLMATLAMILLTALATAALMGLVLVTMRVTAAGERTATEARAADGALEAAIVQMRKDPDSCLDATQTILGGLVFDQGTATTSDDVSTEVTCQPTGGAAGSTDRVRIVGNDGYQGEVKWKTDCVSPVTVPACTPWTTGVGHVPSGLSGSLPGLVHTGPEPLTFASGVTVRTGVAALGSPASGSDNAKPGLVVSGQFAQGSLGLEGVKTSDPCGLLGLTGAAAVNDADDAPSCDDDLARSVADDPTGAEADAGLVAPLSMPALPNCSPPVVRFQPGTYNSAMTSQLSSLLDGSNVNCRNKTFWFAPGIYSLDGPVLAFADPGSYYVFGKPHGWDPTSGVQASAAAADQNAVLCDRDVSGVSLVVSARTALRHSSGRVVMCPAFADVDNPYPSIYQTTTVPSRISLAMVNPTNQSRGYGCDIWGWDWGLGMCATTNWWDFKIASRGNSPISSLKVMVTGSEGNITQNNFIASREALFEIYNKAGGRICRGQFINGTPNGGLTTSYDIAAAASGNGCTSVLNSMTGADLDGMTIRVFMRMWITVVGASQTLTVTGASAQINAMNLIVKPTSVTSPTANWTGLGNIAVKDFPALSASASMAQPIMENSCATAVCQVALPAPEAAPLVTDHIERYEMDIGSLDLGALGPYTAAGVDPELQSLYLLVDLATGQKPLPQALTNLGLTPNNFRADMVTRLELTTAGGRRCVVESGSVNGGSSNATQQVAFNLMSVNNLDPASITCNHDIKTLGELGTAGAKLKLIIDMPCVRNPDGSSHSLCFQLFDTNLDSLIDPNAGPWHKHIWKVRPPSIDRVLLSGTSESYIGPPPNSMVTVNVGPGRASFNVLGSTWLPKTDMDIHWRGEAGTSPIFSHDLVLHGLGSDMSPGAKSTFVCCSKPDTREVQIIATANGRTRVAAAVEFVDVAVIDDGSGSPVRIYTPGTAANVLYWGRCRGPGGVGACASVLGSSATNSGGG